MSVETELTKLQSNLANSYASCESKGATMPSSQNFDNLATTIDSIETGGGGGGTKYGLTMDNILGDVDANGVLQQPTENTGDIVFSGVKELNTANVLAYRFYNNTMLKNGVSFPDLTTIRKSNSCLYMFFGCTGITSVAFPDLTTINGDSSCQHMFNECTGITSVNLSALTTINGYNACQSMFGACEGITSIDLPSLTSVTGSSSFSSMFRVCTGITTVNFSALTTINGYNAFNYMLYGCTSLTDVYFNSLTTTSFGSYVNQFNNMLQNTGTNTTHTLHFPSNLESTISGLTGYPNFGGTSGYVVLAFDLLETS